MKFHEFPYTPLCDGYIGDGWQYFRDGLLIEAERSFARAHLIDPLCASAQFGMAVCAMEKGETQFATSILNALVALNSPDPDWLYNHAAISFDIGEYFLAAESMGRYVQMVGEISPFEASILQVCRAASAGWSIDLPPDIPESLFRSTKLLEESSDFLFGVRGTGLRLAVELSHPLNGLNLEFGTWRGASAGTICSFLDGQLHCFDNLTGLVEDWGNFPRGSYSCKGIAPELPESACLIVGNFEVSLPVFLNENRDLVRFVHFDSDTYSSTSFVLGLISDRLSRGSVLVFDQYFMHETWESSEYAAVQDWLAESGRQVQIRHLSPFTRQAILTLL